MDQDSQDQVEAAQALADGLIVRDLLMNIELVEARVQAVKVRKRITHVEFHEIIQVWEVHRQNSYYRMRHSVYQ